MPTFKEKKQGTQVSKRELQEKQQGYKKNSYFS